MEVLFTETLLPDQEREIRRMTAGCCIPFPEECDGWWLAVDDNSAVLSFLFLCRVGSERWEGTAFTPVGLRRRGYFSLILGEACRNGRIPGNGELVFPVHKADLETCAVMEAIGAELLCEERLMERRLDKRTGLEDVRPSLTGCADCMYGGSGKESAASEAIVFGMEDSEDKGCVTVSAKLPSPLPASGAYYAFMIEENLTAAASNTASSVAVADFSLAVYGKSACLYDFSVHPDMRNRGIGRAVLEQLFFCLAKDGVERLILHVSGDNTAAISLYEKTGFCTTEALLYFLY